jgi:WD40 repeat protein
MSPTKSALIIANCTYEHPDLRQLAAPAQDAESLARVLADRDLGGFEVRTLINEPSYKLNLEIEDFCENRRRDDLLLLYFSGHGIKDADGQLYFATADTQLVQHNVRRATAVSAQFVNEVMSHSRSRQQILLLDCCYSGAFKQGMLAKGDKRVGAGEQLQGQGRIVLTASDALQYSFEGDQVQGEGVRSVFTRTLVQGLESGEADLDRDGLFSLDEVYDYVYSRVSDELPDQKPTKMGFTEGRIFIGSNPRPLAGRLPQELLETLQHPLVWVRVGAVQQLETLLESPSKGLVLAAQSKLSFLAANDDSQQVRAAAAKCLASHLAVPPSPEETGRAAELKTEAAAHAPDQGPQVQAEPTATGSLADASPRMTAPPAPDSAQLPPFLNIGSGKELLTLRGHSGTVHSVAWSQDGQRLATGGEDGTVKLWAPETGQELLTLRRQRQPIWSLAWSSNTEEALLAAGSSEDAVTVWDGKTGKEVIDNPQEGHLVAWRPNSYWLATAGSKLGLVVRNCTTGERLPIRCDQNAASLAWSPDGKRLATGGWDADKVAKVWEAESGKELFSLSGHEGGIYSVSWSPDGTRLATGSNDSTVRVWNVETGKHLLTLTLAERWNEVWAVAWSPDGKLLATGSEDGVPRLWDARTGDERLSLREHGGAVKSVAWSPNGQRLVSASEDGTVKLWEVGKEAEGTGSGKAQTSRQNRSVQGKKRRAEKAEVQRKGRAKPALHAAPEVVQATRLTGPGNERELLSLEGHSEAVWSVAWSPDGARLATASDDGAVKVWNAETGRELLTLRGHGGGVRAVDWTIDLDYDERTNRLAAASTDGWFKIWNADTGEEEGDDIVGGEGWLMAFRPQPHGEPKPASDASWMNRLLRSKASRKEPELTSLAHNVNAGEAWDDSPVGGVAVRKVVTGDGLPILHHRDVVRSIAWSPDGIRMATGTVNGTVRVWMVEKGKELLSIAAHAGPVTSLTWSPDGYRVASASEDGKVNVFGTRGGELLLSVTPPSHPSKLWGVAWSPRGNSLATGSDDQTARVWNVETGGELLTLRGHSGVVRSVAWNPDGKRLATGSDDKTAKVWDVSS